MRFLSYNEPESTWRLLIASKSILGFGVAIYLGVVTTGMAQDSSASTTDTAQSVQALLDAATKDMTHGEWEKALHHVDAALVIDPKNAAVYEQRASIYVEQKLLDLAERDYISAAKLDPTNTTYKYKVGEIEFTQRAYDKARPHFVELQGIGELGELANYKVLVCDLFTSHEARATQDLAEINKVGAGPAYYFGNAAWAWAHGNGGDANKWIASAAQTYDSGTMELYFSCLQRFRPTVASFTTKSGTYYSNAAMVMESQGLRVRSEEGAWSTVPLEELPDDLSPFPVDMRAAISDARRMHPPQPSSDYLVSFTTLKGSHYEQARWAVDQSGVRVLSVDGWTIVPFDQMPKDTAFLPDEMQKRIAACHKLPVVASDVSSVVSFTTKQGKTYDHARVSLLENGLRVLTVDGWIMVPCSQIPSDLSPFPADWRDELQAKTTISRGSLNPIQVVSFTSRNRKAYTNVKASIDDEGLRVLSSNGWEVISFNNLPRDLACFPEGWRERIRVGSSDSVILDSVVSFTTRKGKIYNHVRASIESDELRVLTSDGWTMIAFQQLPEDLSSFPEKWRQRIAEKQHTLAAQAQSSDPVIVR